ncbi:MAG: hypothetical protein IT444_03195 [Phycisphaeraceae bacterium]|nr:hypothetical protein [Phycisphaeraceae bacterium]
MRRRFGLGITLVEMLVVIVTMVAMVAMLLPALQRGRDSARSIVCLSNNRQTTLPVLIEVQEQNGLFPTPTEMVQVADPRTFTCPSDPSPLLLPSAITQRPNVIQSSYAFNPEFSLYRVRYEAIYSPSQRIISYEGYRDVPDSDDNSPGATASFNSQVWIAGNNVTFTHFPPGNFQIPSVLTNNGPDLDAHLHSNNPNHMDLLGNWVVSGGFNILDTLTRDFVPRHASSKPKGDVIFLDGHAEGKPAVTASMVLYPDPIMVTIGNTGSPHDDDEGHHYNGNGYGHEYSNGKGHDHDDDHEGLK